MEYRRKKIIIISVSLLLHITVLALLLIFYTSPEHEWVYFDTTQTSISTPDTIFSEPSQSFPEPQTFNPPVTQEETWAALKPRASTLGGSMDMPDEPIGVEGGDASLAESEESADEQSDAQEMQNDTILRQAQDELNQDTTNFIHAEPVEASAMNQQPIISALNNELNIAQTIKKKASAKKRQAQKALASMTRGYLEQLKHEGENLVKTIGGDPNKMPSAEQLKYERYLAKIQWCLQNAHNINRDKCQNHEPIEATMRVYFTINREGTMADLKIIQSSGSSFADQYIRSLFEQASSSFPPLPAYIKEDPYQLLYSVLVCWNVSNPISMGFMRE